MTDMTDTEALRAELAATVRQKRTPDHWSIGRNQRTAQAALDTIDALRAEVADLRGKLRWAWRERDEERQAKEGNIRWMNETAARAERAEAAIAAAPHDWDCSWRPDPGVSKWEDMICDCWKAAYARASQPAPEPVRIEDMTPGTTFTGRGAPDVPNGRTTSVAIAETVHYTVPMSGTVTYTEYDKYVDDYRRAHWIDREAALTEARLAEQAAEPADDQGTDFPDVRAALLAHIATHDDPALQCGSAALHPNAYVDGPVFYSPETGEVQQ